MCIRDRYNKAKTAEEVLTQQIEQGTAELEYLESVLAALSEADVYKRQVSAAPPHR